MRRARRERTCSGQEPAGLRRRLTVACVGLGLFSVALDTTVNVALPTIAHAFGADIAAVQWVILAFVTTNTGLSVGMGSAADLFSLKRFFLFGLLAYALAMVLMGFSPSLAILVGLRVLQGLGASTVNAVGPALVGVAFGRGRRGRALGVAAGSMAAGTIAASFGGGILVDRLGWPAIFLGRIPFILAAFGTALVALPDDRSRAGALPSTGASRATFDFVGASALCVALVGLLLGLSLVRSQGLGSPLIGGLLLGVLAAGALFLRTERRVPRPALDLRLFGQPTFLAGFLSLFLGYLAAFGLVWLIFPFYVAEVLGESAGVLGVFLGVMAVCSAVAAPLGGWLSDRTGPERPVTLATGVLAVALLWFSRVDAGSSALDVALPIGLVGMALGALQASTYTLALSRVAAERMGTASGAMLLGRSTGVVLAVAGFGALVPARTDGFLPELLATGLGPAAARTEAFVAAFREAFLLGALVAAVAAGISLLAWRRQAAVSEQDAGDA